MPTFVCVDLAANAAVALAIGFVCGMCALVQPSDYAGEQMFHTCVSQARFLRPRTKPKTKNRITLQTHPETSFEDLTIVSKLWVPPEKNQLGRVVKIQDRIQIHCKRSIFVRAILARTGF